MVSVVLSGLEIGLPSKYQVRDLKNWVTVIFILNTELVQSIWWYRGLM